VAFTGFPWKEAEILMILIHMMRLEELLDV
jgi:hypothetical protein